MQRVIQHSAAIAAQRTACKVVKIFVYAGVLALDGCGIWWQQL